MRRLFRPDSGQVIRCGSPGRDLVWALAALAVLVALLGWGAIDADHAAADEEATALATADALAWEAGRQVGLQQAATACDVRAEVRP